ncbi:Monocopper oxidase-like protein SKU5 [Linum perenne]
MELSPPLLSSSNSNVVVSSWVFAVIINIFMVHANSGSVSYEWSVSLSTRAPLGVAKQVIVINDQFPGPLVNATTNDVVNINVHNNLAEPFLITWNGVQLRKNSWQDGVQGTNCPIQPGQNWTYSFQIKDQIGSFFYFPSLLLQKTSGGYGAVRVNNRRGIPIPFPQPFQDIDLLIGDWYNAHHWNLRGLLEQGRHLPHPDGILINGHGPNRFALGFQPGATYRLRISNVGTRTSLNFRIQDHPLLLVETEGSYTVKKYYNSLDIHVGQSYSVLVTAKSRNVNGKSYNMFASSRFTVSRMFGVGVIYYPDSMRPPSSPLPSRPSPFDYHFSIKQARSIKWDLEVGAARRNPQGSYHYGSINVSRTLVLENNLIMDRSNKLRYTVNGVSFVHPDTPLKLADRFKMFDELKTVVVPPIPDVPNRQQKLQQVLGTSVVDVKWRDLYELVFQNPLPYLQTWHLDGYNFFVVGMGEGSWNESLKATYNLVDAISRSTVQVYPRGWTTILVMMDNRGIWNLRSQNVEKWYLGQELYLRVKGVGTEDPMSIPERDESPIPHNAILCGRVMNLTDY